MSPAWWIVYLATVARETGWTAEHILWALPYALGLGIVHVARAYNGEPMEWADGRAGEGADTLRAQLAQVRARYAAGGGETIDAGGSE